jgi:hypothetical protein
VTRPAAPPTPAAPADAAAPGAPIAPPIPPRPRPDRAAADRHDRGRRILPASDRVGDHVGWSWARRRRRCASSARRVATPRGAAWQVGRRPGVVSAIGDDDVVCVAVDGQARARVRGGDAVATDASPTPSRLPPAVHVRWSRRRPAGRSPARSAATRRVCVHRRSLRRGRGAADAGGCGAAGLQRPCAAPPTATAPSELAWDEPADDRPRRRTPTSGAAGSRRPARWRSMRLDRGLPTVAGGARPSGLAATTVLPTLAARTGVPLGFGAAGGLVSLRAGGRPAADRGARARGARRRWCSRPAAAAGDGVGTSGAAPGCGASWWCTRRFHLWNGQVAARADVRDEWLSEGASSFVAGAALVDAGLLDATRWGRRVVAAANRCARSLRGPLYDRAADPSYYDCGEVVHVALDRALAARGGLWPVYARLFADARARPSGTYATADFLALCDGAGADPAIVAAVRAILDRGLGADPQATLRALLADAGIATTVVPRRRGRPSRLRWQPSPRRRPGGSVRP